MGKDLPWKVKLWTGHAWGCVTHGGDSNWVICMIGNAVMWEIKVYFSGFSAIWTGQ